MGGAMAERLAAGGFELYVYDRDPARIEALTSLGAIATGSAREVADRARVVFACLPSTEASKAVAAEVADGNAIETYIETSTIGQDVMSSIAQALEAHGVAVLDMPVSGGPIWAREGKLTGILAGPASVRERVSPVLNCIAGKLIVVGDRPGQGQVAKVVNNALSLTGMMIACEAIVAGVKAGVAAPKLLEVINSGTGRNSATVDKFPRSILPGTFKYGGPIGLGIKDLELYLELNRAYLPSGSLGDTVAELWRTITDDLGGDVDLTAMVRFYEKRAGVEARGELTSNDSAS